jgi:Fe-S cluster biogenesis protein NfuA
MEKSLENIVTVYAEATPNPASMKFVANKMFLPNDSADFRTAESAGRSPLALALFEMPFVKGVFIMNNFVSITKNEDYEWFDLIPDLRSFFTEWIEDGKEIVSKVQELSEMDGGAIDFKSFKDGIVTVQMKGSCSGCPSSTMTLKAGIENLLRRMVPEVQSVEAEAV